MLYHELSLGATGARILTGGVHTSGPLLPFGTAPAFIPIKFTAYTANKL